ncbi:MAG: U32 family peptidase [Endomicrobiales bacterium]
MFINQRKNYFRILAPLTGPEEIGLLKKAGADELYCGYLPEKMTAQWPAAFNVLNRRGEGQSFERFAEMREAARAAAAHRLPLYVTLNGLYTPEQYPLLEELARGLESLPGVTGVIVADMGLLLTLKEKGFKKEVHVSTGGTCFNAGTAGFYASQGAARVILDRQLSAREIKSIVAGARPAVDFEIFIFNEGCEFIDGFCTFFHCFERAAQEARKNLSVAHRYNTEQSSRGCDYFFKTPATAFPVPPRVRAPARLARKPVNLLCRLCDLHELRDSRIRSLKVVGRGKRARDLAATVTRVLKAVAYLRSKEPSKKEYARFCQDLVSSEAFGGRQRCAGRNCYFPHRYSP